MKANQVANTKFEQFVEDNLIKAPHDRIYDSVVKAAEDLERSPSSPQYIDNYVKLESMLLEITELAIDYLKTKKRA